MMEVGVGGERPSDNRRLRLGCPDRVGSAGRRWRCWLGRPEALRKRSVVVRCGLHGVGGRKEKEEDGGLG